MREVSLILSLLLKRFARPISWTKAFDLLMMYTAKSCRSHMCSTVSLETGHFYFDKAAKSKNIATKSQTNPFRIAVITKKYLSTKMD
jgi:hypothetical protein